LGRSVKKILDAAVIKDGILNRVFHRPDGTEVYCIMVPGSLKLHILACYHDSLSGGHLGATKTLSKIRNVYTWPGMTKDVSDYVRACHKCQLHKMENVPPRGFMLAPRHLPQPGDTLAIDLAGPYPKSKSGNTFLLIVVDYLTKWPEIFPLKRATAQAVASCLVKEVFPRQGVPRTIVSDNGKQFVAHIFKVMCSMFGIKRRNTSFYHPQPNLAERTIKTIRSMITTNIEESHRDWDKNLPFLAMALRTAVSESTGFSPSFLMLGREMRLGVDPDALEAELAPCPNEGAWAFELANNVRLAISKAQENIRAQQLRQKPHYDKKRRDLTFQKGTGVATRALAL
jgi:hypothetical protein